MNKQNCAGKIGSYFGFMHTVVVKCSDVSEELTASIFTLNEMGQVVANEILTKK
jgi:hypothetical protein